MFSMPFFAIQYPILFHAAKAPGEIEFSVPAGRVRHAAFLELGQPDLAGAADRLAAEGASRIIVIPYFLTLRTHLQRDLPKRAGNSALKHTQLELEARAPLDRHPALLQVLRGRANESLARTTKPV